MPPKPCIAMKKGADFGKGLVLAHLFLDSAILDILYWLIMEIQDWDLLYPFNLMSSSLSPQFMFLPHNFLLNLYLMLSIIIILDKKRKTWTSWSLPLLALNTDVMAGAVFPLIISWVLDKLLHIPLQIMWQTCMFTKNTNDIQHPWIILEHQSALTNFALKNFKYLKCI